MIAAILLSIFGQFSITVNQECWPDWNTSFKNVPTCMLQGAKGSEWSKASNFLFEAGTPRRAVKLPRGQSITITYSGDPDGNMWTPDWQGTCIQADSVVSYFAQHTFTVTRNNTNGGLSFASGGGDAKCPWAGSLGSPERPCFWSTGFVGSPYNFDIVEVRFNTTVMEFAGGSLCHTSQAVPVVQRWYFYDLPSQTCFQTNSQCNVCAWPYLAKPNTTCGCEVDRGRWQPNAQLQSQCYGYCNTYNGGDGVQYYMDKSRSNFDGNNGQTARCACSSPVNGKTIVRPTQTCPAGSDAYRPPEAPENPNDTQKVKGRVPDSVYNSNGGGGGAGGGDDTGTHRRLDSILGRLGRSSFSDSIIDSLIRSDSLNGDSVAWLSDSVTGITYRLGLVHGDTGMSHGWTDDSLFRWSVRMTGLRDTSVTTNEFADWLIPIWKGLRALLLALWGLACFWIYYSIVKGD